jgi:hypothetical protein
LFKNLKITQAQSSASAINPDTTPPVPPTLPAQATATPPVPFSTIPPVPSTPPAQKIYIFY